MMDAVITGVGTWGPGFSNLHEFCALIQRDGEEIADDMPPNPERIPSRERRRSPLMVRLAVEVADQACTMAAVNPQGVQSVFTSGIGDADITDYMCRVLAGPDKMLSPTRFHNSVHNAAAGVWSISTASVQPSTFVSSLRNSFSMALIEAMVQVTTDQIPVLLIATDIKMPTPMRRMHAIDHLFGIALLLSPTSGNESGSLPDTAVNQSLKLDLAVVPDGQCSTWPDIRIPVLDSLYATSPAARGLCLLEALARAQPGTQPWQATLPVSPKLSCSVVLEPVDNRLVASS